MEFYFNLVLSKIKDQYLLLILPPNFYLSYV